MKGIRHCASGIALTLVCMVMIYAFPLSCLAADYGDAPDSNASECAKKHRPICDWHYPTLEVNNGARHLNINVAWLGQTVSNDAGPKITDVDDDDFLSSYNVFNASWNGLLYVNVLIDNNNDGDWDDSGEWVVQNSGYNVPKGKTKKIGVPSPPPGSWYRITLTGKPISSYTGKGVFAIGETEDYLIGAAKKKKTNPPPPAPFCGNGILEASEQCDPPGGGCALGLRCNQCQCSGLILPPHGPTIDEPPRGGGAGGKGGGRGKQHVDDFRKHQLPPKREESFPLETGYVSFGCRVESLKSNDGVCGTCKAQQIDACYAGTCAVALKKEMTPGEEATVAIDKLNEIFSRYKVEHRQAPKSKKTRNLLKEWNTQKVKADKKRHDFARLKQLNKGKLTSLLSHCRANADSVCVEACVAQDIFSRRDSQCNDLIKDAEKPRPQAYNQEDYYKKLVKYELTADYIVNHGELRTTEKDILGRITKINKGRPFRSGFCGEIEKTPYYIKSYQPVLSRETYALDFKVKKSADFENFTTQVFDAMTLGKYSDAANLGKSMGTYAGTILKSIKAGNVKAVQDQARSYLIGEYNEAAIEQKIKASYFQNFNDLVQKSGEEVGVSKNIFSGAGAAVYVLQKVTEMMTQSVETKKIDTDKYHVTITNVGSKLTKNGYIHITGSVEINRKICLIPLDISVKYQEKVLFSCGHEGISDPVEVGLPVITGITNRPNDNCPDCGVDVVQVIHKGGGNPFSPVDPVGGGSTNGTGGGITVALPGGPPPPTTTPPTTPPPPTTPGTPDTTPPVVTAPASIIVAAVGQSGTPVTNGMIASFLNGATATDNVGVVGGVTNNAPAGFFPVLPNSIAGRVTTVIFTAKDAANNTGTATSTVTIKDQLPPELTLPLPITVTAASGATSVPASNATIATFLNAGQAFDLVDGALSSTTTPAVLAMNPPATFPVGTTVVTFKVTDKAGNQMTGTSSVTVIAAPAPVASCSAGPVTMDAGFDLVVFAFTPFTPTCNMMPGFAADQTFNIHPGTSRTGPTGATKGSVSPNNGQWTITSVTPNLGMITSSFDIPTNTNVVVRFQCTAIFPSCPIGSTFEATLFIDATTARITNARTL